MWNASRLTRCLACLLLVLVLPTISPAQGPQVISATDHRILLDGWDMALPDIVGQSPQNPRMIIFRYTMADKSFKDVTMFPPPEPPIMWLRKRTNELADSPPGYPKSYTEKLLEWWRNGGRGNFLLRNGVWVASGSTPSSAAPPAPAVRPDDPTKVEPRDPDPPKPAQGQKSRAYTEWERQAKALADNVKQVNANPKSTPEERMDAFNAYNAHLQNKPK